MILDCFHKPFAMIALSAIISCGGCVTTVSDNPASTANAAVFVIVRHAEKATNDPKDPTLSETGHARAERLAQRLAIQRMTAVYATGYRRTQQTAAPTAQAHRLEIRPYDAAAPTADFAAQLHEEHLLGSVLVVGHSNTVAAIASALCGCAVTPLREDEYNRWTKVTVRRDGSAKLEESVY